MKFKSNTEMRKFYTKEILDKGRKVTRSEIIEYVQENSRNINKNDVSEKKITSTINDLIKSGKGYERLGRGIYIRRFKDDENENSKYVILKNADDIIRKTEEELENSINMDLNNLRLEDSKEIKDIIDKLKNNLTKSRELLNKYVN